MRGFVLRPSAGIPIRFELYDSIAPVTAGAFINQLPFQRMFFHARVSGEEIWTDSAPVLDIIQENVSVFAGPGEIVIGPAQPLRNRIAGCIGIFYGEGRLVDGGNIFGKVLQEDINILKVLGDDLWRKGGQELFFEPI
jgi:hypothetical protein